MVPETRNQPLRCMRRPGLSLLSTQNRSPKLIHAYSDSGTGLIYAELVIVGRLLHAETVTRLERPLAARAVRQGGLLGHLRHQLHPRPGAVTVGTFHQVDPLLAAPRHPGQRERKTIYDVFRAADSDGWRDAFEFALPVIGIKSWSELDSGGAAEDR